MKKDILLCFIEETENDNTYKKTVDDFVEKGFEIMILNNVIEDQFKPHDLIGILEAYSSPEDYNFYFLSNIKDFFYLVYRIYHQTFEKFIYISDNEINYLDDLDKIYLQILNSDISPNENLFKPIFIDGEINNLFDNKIYNSKCIPLEEIDLTKIKKDNNRIQKYYYYEDYYHLFEVVQGKDQIIDLDNKSNLKELQFFNTKIYYNNLSIQETVELLNQINDSINLYVEKCNQIEDHFNSLRENIKNFNYFTNIFYIKAFELLSSSFNIYINIYVLSFLMQIEKKPKYINRLLSTIISSKDLNANRKFFLLYQCSRTLFTGITTSNQETFILIRKLYRIIYNEFKAQIEESFEFIPKEKRDKDFIIVITGQFLGLNHAPTKTALDRCYNLIKHLKKRVILINTTELLPKKGFSPFYNFIFANKAEQFEELDSFSYKDIDIPFYQTAYLMPDINEIYNILSIVNKYKPNFIMSIGSANITADLCSNLVPVLSISTVYSGLPLTEGQFHVIGRKVTNKEIEFLNEFGFSKENIVESTFTFDFKPQNNIYTRKELNLPDDKFLLAIVGARLDQEVTDEFIEMLMKTANVGTHFVFIGIFDNYHKIAANNQCFANNSTYLGFQDDVLAVLEVCDLYVNPIRSGGGSSAVEAMFKGLPVITIGNGDVSVAAGMDFFVNSYGDMTRTIKKYKEDNEFYNQMSKKARERADVLLNTHKELDRIIKEIENREIFD
jgi:glycosyltransferase involved in cell wall biosynthesis